MTDESKQMEIPSHAMREWHCQNESTSPKHKIHVSLQ